MSQNSIDSKIKELQMLEQQRQIFLMEKQSTEVEFNEVSNAIQELNNTNDEVYKIIGGIMVKSEKKNIIQELNDKKKILEIKISSLDKQDRALEARSAKLKSDFSVSMQKK